jgi:hypothetical protein
MAPRLMIRVGPTETISRFRLAWDIGVSFSTSIAPNRICGEALAHFPAVFNRHPDITAMRPWN